MSSPSPENAAVGSAADIPLPPSPVTLTADAAAMVQEAMIAEGFAGHSLRIGVYGGGCAGLQYLLDFTDRPTPDDFVFEQHGVTLIVDPFSAEHLRGTTIRYVKGPSEERSGFKFDNPNVKRTCGCGMAG